MCEDEKRLEGKVRRRAFELWEQDGMPEGRDQEFWHRATEELSEHYAPDGAGVKVQTQTSHLSARLLS